MKTVENTRNVNNHYELVAVLIMGMIQFRKINRQISSHDAVYNISAIKSGDKYDSSATSYLSWDPQMPVKLRMENDGPASLAPTLVQTFFRKAVEERGQHIAIKYKDETNDIISLTYNVSEVI